MSYLDVLSERQGFGNKATGGKAGPTRAVRTPSELSAALSGTNPLWITLAPGTYTGRFKAGSNKTIDARGGGVKITGPDNGGLLVEGAKNLIVLNVNFDGGWDKYTTDTEGADAVQIRDAYDLWFHHCRFAQWKDGCVDAKEAVKNLSVTWSRFEKNRQALLWKVNGGTLAYCYASDIGLRFPKSVGGKVHAYNNFIERWSGPEIECARDNGILLSEYSIWLPGKTAKVGLTVAGGKIQSSKHHPLKATTFVSGSIGAKFIDEAHKVSNITKPKSDKEWQSLQKQLVAECGPTLALVA